MNKLEVKIILGLPMAERKNGAKTRWVYPRNYVVLFTNGTVERVIE